jgi:hypothetical protein
VYRLRLLGEIDDTHATLTEDLQDPVMADALRSLNRRWARVVRQQLLDFPAKGRITRAFSLEKNCSLLRLEVAGGEKQFSYAFAALPCHLPSDLFKVSTTQFSTQPGLRESPVILDRAFGSSDFVCGLLHAQATEESQREHLCLSCVQPFQLFEDLEEVQHSC